MAIERKSGLFYELMIRGNWDPAKGELGAVTTYQFQTGTALVDTDTNALVAPYAPDPAVDLTKDRAVAFLDGKFSTFLGQLADAQKALAERQAELDMANETVAELKSAVADLESENAHLRQAATSPEPG
jgi:hypothetical protein